MTPNGKLIAFAVCSLGTVDVEPLQRATGLDKSATKRALDEFLRVDEKERPLSASKIKTPQNPVSAPKNMSLMDVMTYFVTVACQRVNTLSKHRTDYARLRNCCRVYGTPQVVKRINDYFLLGNYATDANVGILSFIRYLNRVGERKATVARKNQKTVR